MRLYFTAFSCLSQRLFLSVITVCCAEVLLQKYANRQGFINCLLQGITIFCKGSFSHELVVNTVLPFCFLVSTEYFINTQNAFAYRHQTAVQLRTARTEEPEPPFRSERLQRSPELFSPPTTAVKADAGPETRPPGEAQPRSRGSRPAADAAPSPAELPAHGVT